MRTTSSRRSPRPRRRRSRSTPAPSSRSAELESLVELPSQYVVVGSGKTATDACIWLLGNGVDPGRDLLGPSARPLDAQPCRGPAGPGRVHRHGRRHRRVCCQCGLPRRPVPPARGGRGDAARRPGRGAHDGPDADVGPVGARPAAQHRERRPARSRAPGRARSDRARRRAGADSGRRASWCTAQRAASPTYRRSRSGPRTQIRLQPIRSGFPCFAAALAGYVEASRSTEAEKNRAVPLLAVRQPAGGVGADDRPRRSRGGGLRCRRRTSPSGRSSCLLNPARVAPEHRDRPEVLAAQQRVARVRPERLRPAGGPGLAREPGTVSRATLR